MTFRCGRTLQTAHTGQWRQCARAARDTTKGSWRVVEGGVEPAAVSGWRRGYVSGRSAAAAAACGKVRVFRQRVAAPTGLLRERIQKAYGAFEAELKAEWLQTDRSNFIYSRYH